MEAATDWPGEVPEGVSSRTREVEALRASTWTLLGSLLRQPPDGDMLSSLAVPESVPSDDERPLAAAWRALADAAATADPEQLDDQFHALFIGLGRGELVPYGSWYRTGFLMDRPLVSLRRDLALLGFERMPCVCEPEDHVSALAEVMGLLADPLEGQDRSTQALFFRAHVDAWMPSLFADMQQAESARFYRCVGGLGAAFLDFERAWLAASGDPDSLPAGTPAGDA